MITPVQSQRYAQLVNNFNEKEFYAYYNHLGEGGTVEDFFERIEKHGDHDQSSHGAWSTGGGEKVIISPANEGNRKVSLGQYSADYKINDVEATAKNGQDFMNQWNKNYEMRTVSAYLMGIEGAKSMGKEDSLEHDYLATLKNPFGNDPEEFVHAKPIVEAIAGGSRLIEAIHNETPSEVNLFRGIKAESGSQLRTLQEGQTFELPLSSFAQKSYYAETFAGTSGERSNIKGTSIIFSTITSSITGTSTIISLITSFSTITSLITSFTSSLPDFPSSYLVKKCRDVNEIIGSNPPSKNANHLFIAITSLALDPIISHTGPVNSIHDLNSSPVSSISL